MLYIAVHIRRTDMVYHNVIDYGVDYLYRSFVYMIQRFHDRCLLFVVCSDDNIWATTNIQSVLSNLTVPAGRCRPQVAFFAGPNGSQDMAVLASCNHTIITMGTFGWWSAYLAGGLTVYSKTYPPVHKGPLSIRENDVNLPAWIGLPWNLSNVA